ncbi:3',5'-cyclic adenosine monophosphate phosphodiesterase CpdA [subsurface metagenome]
MFNHNKQISNPSSAGDVGGNFETDIGKNKVKNRFGFIQLSDLQFGENHRFGNPSTIAEKLLSDIKKMSGEYDFTPLYIVLSGDITEKAHSEEFNGAANVIEEILNGVNIDRTNILCVPGNHDVNWNLSEYSQEAGDDQLKFLPYNNFASTITNSKDCSVRDCYPRIIDDQLDLGLEFLLLNSCEKEDRSNHNGYVSLEKLKKTLPSQALKGDERLKIAILHHRLDTSITDKRSAIENAPDIEAILACNKYNIVLTGHAHQALCHDVNNSDGHNIIFAGCGSTGADYRQREDGIQNQYCIHVIDLDANEFQSIWRAYNPSLQTEYGLGGWTRDNSFNEEPRKFALPTIKRAGAISSQTMINPALSTGNNICSNSVTDNIAEKISEDIDIKPSVQEKTNWNNFKHAAKIAIANLLGGWDENV